MIFVKRIVHSYSRPGSYGYAVFDETKFKEWVDAFMIYERVRRELCLFKNWGVGLGFLADYKWTVVTGAEASALSEHICGGYNICVGNIPTIEALKENTEYLERILEEEKEMAQNESNEALRAVSE